MAVAVYGLWMLLLITAVAAMLIAAALLGVLVLPLSYHARAGLRDPVSCTLALRLWRLAHYRACYVDHAWEQQFYLCGIPLIRKRKRPDQGGPSEPTAKRSKKGRKRKQKAKETEQRQGQEKGQKQEKKQSSFWRSLTDKEQRQNTLRFARDILVILKPDTLQLTGRVGLDEPHLTGWLYAAIAPLTALGPGVKLAITPVWDEACCDLDAELEGRFLPLVLCGRLLRYACSRPVRKIWIGKLAARMRGGKQSGKRPASKRQPETDSS